MTPRETGSARRQRSSPNLPDLTSNQPNPANDVYITTIQRFYSILKGEPEFDPALELAPLAEQAAQFGSAPLPVVYNDKIPIEFGSPKQVVMKG